MYNIAKFEAGGIQIEKITPKATVKDLSDL